MPYPEDMVAPMRAELTSFGVQELRTAEEVDTFFADKTGTAFDPASILRPAPPVLLKGDEEIEYDGEIHTAANLFDALKEGYYGKF